MVAEKRVPYHGRRKPYTDQGISRVPCSRCGEPSARTWQICSNDNRHVGVCPKCDVLLNETVLQFMNIPNAEELIELYRHAPENVS